MNYRFNEQSLHKVKRSTYSIYNSQIKQSTNKKTHRPLLSIIVPVYNETEVLEYCHQRLSVVADMLPVNTEIIYINDGSSDESLALLYHLKQQDARIAVIDLSRNFGKEIAMTAGLDHSQGDAVIVIDADLQDPPELIPKMIAQWQCGYDIVYMKRASRKGESWFKKFSANVFYRLINRISKVDIPEGVGDFRLLSRRAVDSLCQFRESNRYMKGLFAWLGYKQKAIIYDRDERASGSSKWKYLALFDLAVDGITAFSTAPLKLASYIGIMCVSLSMLASIWLVVDSFIFNASISSMKLLVTGLFFFGGMQMIMLGILGEYLGRMYMETKNRPLYLINAWTPAFISDDVNDLNQTGCERHLS